MNIDQTIKQELMIINNKLDAILQLVETDSKKMNNHIDFIENVYNKVKYPFGYIMESVNKFITNDDNNNKVKDCNYSLLEDT